MSGPTFPQKAGIEDDLRGLEADQKQLAQPIRGHWGSY